VRLRNWPIDRLRRRIRRSPHEPLVLVQTLAGRQIVVAVSSDARARGVWAGMTLVEARAMHAELIHADHDAAGDVRGLTALAKWMQRFTPVVCLPEDLAEGHADYLFLDLSGCERLFGGLSHLVNLIDRSLKRLRISAKLAIAPTPGAAWAMASFAKQSPALCQSPIEQAIAPLPVAGLRIDAPTAEALHHLGIETIGQLMQLPRQTLPARFGPGLLRRLDQALGRIDEPLVALGHDIPIVAQMQFEAAIDSLEVIWLAFEQILQQIVTELARRGCGARELKVIFPCGYAPPIEKTIRLSRPSRNLVNLFNLLRCALETIEANEGFIGVKIDVTRFERINPEQAMLLAQEELIHRDELDHLIERLCARMGPDSLVQAQRVEEHVPERAYAWRGSSPRDSQITLARKTPASDWRDESNPRPLNLLPDPTELRVMVAPSDDREGRPVQFALGRAVHPVRLAIGPERISGQWWRGHDKTRDYYEVENSAGERFWIFRVRETGKWYLHGM
jgi:protein ImuB